MSIFKYGFLVVFSSFLFLTGCASVPMAPTSQDMAMKRFEPVKNKSGIYIYRNEVFGAAIKTTVLLDGKFLGDTASKTYLYALVSPGEHQITSKSENDDVLKFNTLPGKDYYVWQEIKMGMWAPRSELHLMSESEGQAGVKESALANSSLK